jgi:hypothetical protein
VPKLGMQCSVSNFLLLLYGAQENISFRFSGYLVQKILAMQNAEFSYIDGQ